MCYQCSRPTTWRGGERRRLDVADGSADRLSREVSRDAQVRWSRGGEQFAHATQDAAFNGLMGTVGALAVEREDGTLLRAKALPQGMLGYLVGRVVQVTLSTLIALAIVLVAGLLLAPPILRRMARRESGSLMQQRRDRAMQRIG
ncbi:hypothetical protein ACFLIM_02140 [Nonomuraea sp. M3C6]|uniref:Uncharacterized protein n=1 Tax=Nonomuraea marmarensis TaxID=3351344 RepID=A0ABW7A4L7_9ACTN